MKNKEKAKQIVDRIFESGFNTNRTFYDMALNSAIEMAAYKDNEHHKKLASVIDWMEGHINEYIFADEYKGRTEYKIKSEFFDDFKERML